MRQNPPYNRFKYIAKQYGEKYPGVVVDTFTVLSDTVGIEHPENIYDWVRPAWMRVPLPGRFTYEPLSKEQERALLQDALRDLANDPRMATGRDSDALWPWVAKELARVYKTAPGDYGDLRNRALGKGSALALWQKQERIDLGRWKLGQALQALNNFVVEQDVPQGEVVYQFPDGWTVQRLDDERQLKVEGEVMQHCVGTYCELVESGDTVIFSLRDPQGRPHATMEYRESINRFIQVQGKQNRDPKPEYAARVEKFRKDKGFEKMGLSDKERSAFHEIGDQLAGEDWEDRSWRPGFSVIEARHDAPELDWMSALDKHDEFRYVLLRDLEDSDLSDEIQDAIDSGITDRWDAEASHAQELIDVAITDVVDRYTDDYGSVADAVKSGDVDIEELASEVLGDAGVGGGDEDKEYVKRELEAYL